MRSNRDAFGKTLTWPDRRLLELLCIEHPITLAPMGGFAAAVLALSVCAAGSLGSIGCAGLSSEAVRDAIAQLRARTARPINVNFFCHAPAPPNPGREDAWRRRLEPYWREFRNDALGAAPPVQVPPFDDAMCQVVEGSLVVVIWIPALPTNTSMRPS